MEEKNESNIVNLEPNNIVNTEPITNNTANINTNEKPNNDYVQELPEWNIEPPMEMIKRVVRK